MGMVVVVVAAAGRSRSLPSCLIPASLQIAASTAFSTPTLGFPLRLVLVVVVVGIVSSLHLHVPAPVRIAAIFIVGIVASAVLPPTPITVRRKRRRGGSFAIIVWAFIPPMPFAQTLVRFAANRVLFRIYPKRRSDRILYNDRSVLLPFFGRGVEMIGSIELLVVLAIIMDPFRILLLASPILLLFRLVLLLLRLVLPLLLVAQISILLRQVVRHFGSTGLHHDGIFGS
jgi:hypothetical protein